MDKVQHRLFHFEAQPPAKAWESIEASLDTEIEFNFPEKLRAYETTPPNNSWSKIEAILDKKDTPIIPFTKRLSKAYRYGAAAVILLMATFFFISKKPSDDRLSNRSDSGRVETNYLDKASVGGQRNDLAGNSAVPGGSVSLPERKENIRLLMKSSVVLPRQSVKTSFHQPDDIIIPKNIPVVKSNMPERYIVFSNNSGEAIRLSKKLFDLFACADDTENCRRNIEWVQQQMAAPDRMASADFGDVLELLQEMKYQ